MGNSSTIFLEIEEIRMSVGKIIEDFPNVHWGNLKVLKVGWA